MVKQPPQNTIAPQQNTGLYFARHETFYPRFGWLKKGFEAVNRNPHIFLAEDAHIQLGVGKNMAKAIRYWCGAFKLIHPDFTPSELGTSLLGDSGYDRFLEDPATLWWLHWHLLKSPCTATTWDFAFNSFLRHPNAKISSGIRNATILSVAKTLFQLSLADGYLVRMSELVYNR